MKNTTKYIKKGEKDNKRQTQPDEGSASVVYKNSIENR